MQNLTLRQADRWLKAGLFSSRQIVEHCLQRIAETDGTLNAWITLNADEALAEAAAADDRRKHGQRRGVLDGVPYACKDLIDTAGLKTTAASKVLQGNVPRRDATVVTRLRGAGAILLGKTNMHEFAYGPFSVPTANPWDVRRTPGGSSGGTGAAVAAEQAPWGLGTDTGGSIRMPSAFCGITGLKPTFGRVPKDGVAVLSWTMDNVGPMCWTAEDAAIILNVIAGHADHDPTSALVPSEDFTRDLERPLAGLRLGRPVGYFTSHYPAVNGAFDAAVQVLRAQGTEVVEVAAPKSLDFTQEVGFAMDAEASAWHGPRLRRQAVDYRPDVRTWLRLGEMILATDFINAKRYRSKIIADMRGLYDEHRLDALVTPTMPATAAEVGQAEYRAPDGFVEPVMHAMLRNCWPFNLTGQPALTVPCGFDEQGLPVGLQIVGRPWQEALVLRIGHQYQRVTDWHARRPPVGSAQT